MANERLKRKSWNIPFNILNQLNSALQQFKGNKKTSNFVSLENLIKNKTISYENAKKIKSFYENGKYSGPKIDFFISFIDNKLKTSRDALNNVKDVKQDLGMNNTHIKSHNKNHSGNTTNVNIPKIKNNKVVYEGKKQTTLFINEHVYNKIINNVE